MTLTYKYQWQKKILNRILFNLYQAETIVFRR